MSNASAAEPTNVTISNITVVQSDSKQNKKFTSFDKDEEIEKQTIFARASPAKEEVKTTSTAKFGEGQGPVDNSQTYTYIPSGKVLAAKEIAVYKPTSRSPNKLVKKTAKPTPDQQYYLGVAYSND